MAKPLRRTTDAVMVLASQPLKQQALAGSRRIKTLVLASVMTALGVLAIDLGSSGLHPTVDPTLADRPPGAPVSLLSPDWISLDRGPLAARRPAVVVWTGKEVVVWGGAAFSNGQPLGDGAAYDPAAGNWRWLSPGPLAAQQEAAWVWTGTELIVWSAEGSAAAWAPADNQWRAIRGWPLRAQAAVTPIWTGRDIVDLRAAVALNPSNGQVRQISLPPGVGNGSGIMWTGAEILSLEAGVAYDPWVDSWRRLADTGPTDTWVAGASMGELVVAVDYLLNSATYDLRASSWTSLPEVPLRSFGCAPRLHGTGSSVIAELCGGIGLLHAGGSGWMPLGPPVPSEANTVVVAGGEAYAWGDGLYRMRPDVLRGVSPPRRLALGVSLLDLPMNWTLGSARLESPSRIAIDAKAPSGASCRVAAVHSASNQPASGAGMQGTGDVPGVEAAHLSNDLSGAGSHLTWAASHTDLIDVACSDPESARLVAQSILTP